MGGSIAEAMVNDGKMVNRTGLSRKHIFDAVEASVKRLGTYIDVLQIHRLDRGVPREEIMKALNDVIEKGWVRYIGASSVSNRHEYPGMGEWSWALTTGEDGCLGVPIATEHCSTTWLAPIYKHAKLLQFTLS